MGQRDRRTRALFGSSQEQASGPVRVSPLHARLRHLPARLPADERRARLHAAAGPAADRRLSAAEVGGPLRRREHPHRRPPRISTGRTPCWSAACTSRRRRSTTSAARRTRPARSVAGRPVGVRLPETIRRSTTSDVGETGRRHRRADRPPRPRAARPPEQMRSATNGARRSRSSRPGLRPDPLSPVLPRHRSSPAAAPIAASSATSRRSTAAAAAEDAGAGDRRAGRDARPAGSAGIGLLRRRQLHRQPQGGQGDAAASGRVAEGTAIRCSSPARRR